MLITKASGDQELFRSDKLKDSLESAGASKDIVRRIITHVESELEEEITTTEIYNHAFALLKQLEERPIAARYSLKRAVMDLGPTGFPFEKLIAEIFRAKGYKAQTNIMMSGKCVRHEIDFLAEKTDSLILGEAKFHNKPGYKTDLKTALYIDARFKDIQGSQFGGLCGQGQVCQCWLVTNTKFTTNAKSYARCTGGMTLVGWDYPKEDNLRQMIENTSLHPLTCLTTLSKAEKQHLFTTGNVLCRSLKDNDLLLREIGIVGSRANDVLDEVALLCPIFPLSDGVIL